MPLFGKCPHCEKLVTNLDATPIDVHAAPEKTARAVAYLCPSCHVVIGAGADPISLAHEVADLLRNQR